MRVEDRGHSVKVALLILSLAGFRLFVRILSCTGARNAIGLNAQREKNMGSLLVVEALCIWTRGHLLLVFRQLVQVL
jgi:hypothetical protein